MTVANTTILSGGDRKVPVLRCHINLRFGAKSIGLNYRNPVLSVSGFSVTGIVVDCDIEDSLAVCGLACKTAMLMHAVRVSSVLTINMQLHWRALRVLVWGIQLDHGRRGALLKYIDLCWLTSVEMRQSACTHQMLHMIHDSIRTVLDESLNRDLAGVARAATV